jgi:phosphate transport system protein
VRHGGSLTGVFRLFGLARSAPPGPDPAPVRDDEWRGDVVRVFALVGEAIAGATHALLAGDRELAKRVVAADTEIDALVDLLVDRAEAELVTDGSLGPEERRTLLTLLRILPEVERNGDLAEHIARRAARGLGGEMSPRSRGLVERMGEVASAIWREATDVIVDGKREAAGVLEEVDDELDDLHVSLTAELTSGSMALPVAVEVALVGRFYERFGDHCVNLARHPGGRDGGD